MASARGHRLSNRRLWVRAHPVPGEQPAPTGDLRPLRRSRPSNSRLVPARLRRVRVRRGFRPGRGWPHPCHGGGLGTACSDHLSTASGFTRLGAVCLSPLQIGDLLLTVWAFWVTGLLGTSGAELFVWGELFPTAVAGPGPRRVGLFRLDAGPKGGGLDLRRSVPDPHAAPRLVPHRLARPIRRRGARAPPGRSVARCSRRGPRRACTDARPRTRTLPWLVQF